MIYPLVYFAYILLRGDLLAAYPYPFIDVASLGYPQVFINAGGIGRFCRDCAGGGGVGSMVGATIG